MFKDSTRKIIFMFGFTLCVLTVYTMIYYPNTLFKEVLVYFMGVFSTYIGMKGGSTLPEQLTQQTIPNPPSQDSIVLEK